MQNKLIKINRALLSVSNKDQLETIARVLHQNNVEIISTGGTGKFLSKFNIPYTSIEKITNNPQSFAGRMKTISFQIASGILFRRDCQDDLKQAKELGISPIDLVICNLYPFEEVSKRDHTFEQLIENIDIGGPTMIRAAAKNFSAVTVCTSPQFYNDLIKSLHANDCQIDLALRQSLALEAFRHTANYDSIISQQLEKSWEIDQKTIFFSTKNIKELRYGENPHQKAWVYSNNRQEGIAAAQPLQGKPLSYNNLLDADAGWRCTSDLAKLTSKEYNSAVSIIKHLNPCGAAIASSNIMALKMAWAADPISSFGSIICFNNQVDLDCAEWLADKFIEIVLAPSFTEQALQKFSQKKNLRLIPIAPLLGKHKDLMIRTISGGIVAQEEDCHPDLDIKLVTQSKFSQNKDSLINFGIIIAKHLRSNSIALVDQNESGLLIAGVGMGNPNRLISIHQAVAKAKENGHDNFQQLFLISDAFFPFADNIEESNRVGIKNIIQPGGSIKDKEVICACDKYEIAMAFTGRRHFRH